MLYELTIFNRGISKVWAAQVNNMPVAPTQYLAVSALDDNNKTAAVWCTQLGLGARARRTEAAYVAGVRARRVEAGSWHACALGEDGARMRP